MEPVFWQESIIITFIQFFYDEGKLFLWRSCFVIFLGSINHTHDTEKILMLCAVQMIITKDVFQDKQIDI